MTSHSHLLRRSTRTRHGHRLEAWCGASTYTSQPPSTDPDDDTEPPPADACAVCVQAWQAQTQEQRDPAASNS